MPSTFDEIGNDFRMLERRIGEYLQEAEAEAQERPSGLVQSISKMEPKATLFHSRVFTTVAEAEKGDVTEPEGIERLKELAREEQKLTEWLKSTH